MFGISEHYSWARLLFLVWRSPEFTLKLIPVRRNCYKINIPLATVNIAMLREKQVSTL